MTDNISYRPDDYQPGDSLECQYCEKVGKATAESPWEADKWGYYCPECRAMRKREIPDLTPEQAKRYVELLQDSLTFRDAVKMTKVKP